MGDCNSKPVEEIMRNFMELYDLNNPVCEPTCYKNLDKPSCIELSLTKKIQGNYTSRAFILLRQDCLISIKYLLQL